MGRAEKVLTAIGRLYEAVLEPDCWSDATRTIADTTASHHVLFFSAHPAQRALNFHAVHGIDPEYLSPFRTAVVEGRVPRWFHTIPVGVTQNSSNMQLDGEFLRSAFYNEALRPHGGGFYAAVAPLQRQPDRVTIFTVCRVLGSRHYDQDEIDTVQTLAPHLTAALRMRERFGLSDLRAQTVLTMLDQLSCGVILVDAALRPIFVNARAEAISNQSDAITLSTTQVTTRLPRENLALRQAVTSAIALVSGRDDPERLITSQKAARITLSRTDRLPLLVTVIPIWATNGWAGTSACAAIFLDESDRLGDIDAEAVSRTFDLAPREVELTLLLGQGNDLATAAAQLGIGIGTARWYLKRIQEKTETHRQAELVRLLAGFARR